MPVEPKTKLKRRPGRQDADEFKYDGVHARELEQKRNRGEVSCAECRRLKIKCDKQIPCQSCQRRGCGTLCPNGSLATGQGTRFVLAATEHLHKRIAKLSGRVRQLEDALASVHGEHSGEPHPLLHSELILADEAHEDSPTEDQHPADVIDAFGTLSIADHGISRFFGPTGGSESLLVSSGQVTPESSVHSPSDKQASLSPSASGVPIDFSLFSQSFPFTPVGRSADVQDMIREHLPPWDRACALTTIYFEQAAWLFRGVTREQLIEDMLPAIYRKSSSYNDDFAGPHDLALLFVIFAVAVLVENEPDTQYAEHYHQISRAAISLQPILEKPSIVTIQSLHLMSIYNAMSGSDLTRETSMEMTWSLITLAAHLSQTIGLHRDCERWGLPPKMVQRRRILFWDLFVADVWTSLNTGRPPSFSLPYIDCSFPRYDNDKSLSSAFEIWQFRFASECVAEVAAQTLTAETPSYATIMELDRKVREFPLPEATADKDDLAASFQRCVLEHIRETVLMYIHRSFFAQAIIEQPVNPLKSTYAPSFLAAYRASTTILKSVRDQFTMHPNACARWWTMWTFAFSAAVVFGTVVTRGPRSPLANSAMTELESACLLFTKASVYSKRAAKALPILIKLSEKARHALQETSTNDSDTGMLWDVNADADGEDELSIFAGHTRFVSTKKPTRAFHGTPERMMETTNGGGSYGQLPALTSPVEWARQGPQLNYAYPSHPPQQHQHQHQHQQQSFVRSQGLPHYGYPPQGVPQAPQMYVGPRYPALADLGLSSRDSRLDERWSSFMHESGLLDDVNNGYRG